MLSALYHFLDLASFHILKLSLFSEYGKRVPLNMTSFPDTFLEEGAAERIQRRGLGFVFKRGFVSEIERLNLGLKTVGKCQFPVITAASLYISAQILCLDHQIFYDSAWRLVSDRHFVVGEKSSSHWKAQIIPTDCSAAVML